MTDPIQCIWIYTTCQAKRTVWGQAWRVTTTLSGFAHEPPRRPRGYLLDLDLGRLEEAIWPAGARLPLTHMGGREGCGLVGGFHGVHGPGQTPDSCTRLSLWLPWAHP